jgi:hypothetical protein
MLWLSGLQEYYAIAQSHYMKLQTANETHQELLREQYNITFAEKKKLLTEMVNEAKAKSALELTLLQGFELEKIKLAENEANLVLAANEVMLNDHRNYVKKRIELENITDVELRNLAIKEKI